MIPNWNDALWAHGTWTFDDSQPQSRVEPIDPTPPSPAPFTPGANPEDPTDSSPGANPGNAIAPPHEAVLRHILSLLVPYPEARLAVAQFLVGLTHPKECPQ